MSQVPGRQPRRRALQLRANVRGLGDFPEDTWPTNIELLFHRHRGKAAAAAEGEGY